MLTRENDVEVHALHKRGWTISAIARYTGHDRKTIRAYLNGERTPGERKKPAVDLFDPFLAYVRARLDEDPHLWSRTLCDELEDLGYTQSYQRLTRQIRQRGLRPRCEECAQVTERANAVIEHPPGEETQWDWVELPNPPAGWNWGPAAYLLFGSLAHSGRWRGYLAPDMTRPQVIAGLDRITRRLGGVTKKWRFDRMATVCHPATGALTAEFAGVAKHYGVSVAVCPPRRGNRKGLVEKANHTAAQRWWRTLPDDMSVTEAQASCDTFCRTRSDVRMRRTKEGRANVATVAAREPLSAPTATGSSTRPRARGLRPTPRRGHLPVFGVDDVPDPAGEPAGHRPSATGSTSDEGPPRVSRRSPAAGLHVGHLQTRRPDQGRLLRRLRDGRHLFPLHRWRPRPGPRARSARRGERGPRGPGNVDDQQTRRGPKILDLLTEAWINKPAAIDGTEPAADQAAA